MKTLPKNEKEVAMHYIETLVGVARDPFLILDKDLRVIRANNSFYRNFQVTSKDTENRFVYDLGNGQWNIPQLKELLENVLPQKKVITDYEVGHDFQTIGRRVMVLNAQQVDSVELIILCFEDVTEKREVEKKMREYTKGLEVKVAERTKDLSERVKDLEELTQIMVGRELKMSELKKEIIRIKKLKKLNGYGDKPKS